MSDFAPLRLVRLPAILRAYAPPAASNDAGPRHSSQPFPLQAATRAGLHEVYASTVDAAAATGFALGLAKQCHKQKAAILWARHEALHSEAGYLYPPGLVEFGVSPSSITLLRLSQVQSLLQAGLDAARCRALSAIIVEFQGEAKAYDLTASRKLALAATQSGVALFLIRHGGKVLASAAETRWHVRSARSRPRAANAPGAPAFEATLLRQRGRGAALAGQIWCVEWNRDAATFDVRRKDQRQLAPLPRPMAALSSGGTPPLLKAS